MGKEWRGNVRKGIKRQKKEEAECEGMRGEKGRLPTPGSGAEVVRPLCPGNSPSAEPQELCPDAAAAARFGWLCQREGRGTSPVCVCTCGICVCVRVCVWRVCGCVCGVCVCVAHEGTVWAMRGVAPAQCVYVCVCVCVCVAHEGTVWAVRGTRALTPERVDGDQLLPRPATRARLLS